MEDEKKRVEILKNKLGSHRKHVFDRNLLYKSYIDSIFRDFDIKIKNQLAVVDFILVLFQQFLALSATGYVGLLVAPKDLLNNISSTQSILLRGIIWFILGIILFLILKIYITYNINLAIEERMKFFRELYLEEKKNLDFDRDMMESFWDIEETINNGERVIHASKNSKIINKILKENPEILASFSNKKDVDEKATLKVVDEIKKILNIKS